MSMYAFHLKSTLAIEILVGKYAFYNYYLKAANSSGTLKAYCIKCTTLVHAPTNLVNTTKEQSASCMSKVHAHTGYLHNTSTVTLTGIQDPNRQVLSQWQEGE